MYLTFFTKVGLPTPRLSYGLVFFAYITWQPRVPTVPRVAEFKRKQGLNERKYKEWMNCGVDGKGGPGSYWHRFEAGKQRFPPVMRCDSRSVLSACSKWGGNSIDRKNGDLTSHFLHVSFDVNKDLFRLGDKTVFMNAVLLGGLDIGERRIERSSGVLGRLRSRKAQVFLDASFIFIRPSPRS